MGLSHAINRPVIIKAAGLAVNRRRIIRRVNDGGVPRRRKGDPQWENR
jgi:hypothetical protein